MLNERTVRGHPSRILRTNSNSAEQVTSRSQIRSKFGLTSMFTSSSRVFVFIFSFPTGLFGSMFGLTFCYPLGF